MVRTLLAASLCLVAGACQTAPSDPLVAGGNKASLGVTEVLADGRFQPGRSGWQRHEASYASTVAGLVCPETVGERTGSPFTLSSIITYDAEGLDTSCNYVGSNAGTLLTIYASYYPDEPLDAHFAESRRYIEGRFGAGSRLSIRAPRVPSAQVRSAAYGYSSGDIPGVAYDRVTTLWIAERCGWHLKARATYPAQVAAAEDVALTAFETAAGTTLDAVSCVAESVGEEVT